MSRTEVQIPKLPGFGFSHHVGKSDFRKASRFGYKDGQCIYTPREEQEQAKLLGDRPLTNTRHPFEMSSSEWMASKNPLQSESSFTPRYALLDKKVLRYYGVYVDTVDPSVIGSAPLDAQVRDNNFVHECTILYYLEDGTMQVGEKRQDNSGMMQGQVVKRTHVPKPIYNEEGWILPNPNEAPNGTASLLNDSSSSLSSFYTPDDFEIGGEINIFGRLFYIFDCDQFTRDYHDQVLGRPIEPAVIHTARQNAPKDKYIAHVTRQKTAKMELAHRHTAFAASGIIKEEDHGAYLKFLQWDTKVLRFYCVWDDRQTMYGDQRKFVIRYYLANDTMDMVEDKVANSGRVTGNFLKRGRVPKKTPASIVGTGDVHTGDYYTPADLMVGDTITIYNRIFFIYGCDEFTRRYYAQNFGISDMPEYDVEHEQQPQAIVRAPVPPYTGFGTQEDSFGSVLYLVPKPPHKSFQKMLDNEKKRLRFRARLAKPKDSLDEQRRFIITYFMGDDSISVYEETINNSGRVGGKFLERSKIAKPDPELGSSNLEYYEIQDMIIDTVVTFNCHEFYLMEIDEYSRKILLKMFPGREDLVKK
ncbi:hypothetical protein GUITHDRAFT_99798 [Guillardia theta CCMP2712]|uniref:DM10 domain-containing protein n=1 Tax=Guillardia theta (strain CCMP2712) TaxID=905079 RepID=L1K0H1_GUITC|nr:hypothetical protein GUITHDRAFT_99798 [Guillardia theta CCMP2712]EKX54321.1 hypothetical protein GUITHDRAFT_99798 [Guillardia theta CCMP2712]|eukprot:XP_005841301.1 hypothetical protein GUITHDRAFT_99798 [Guillardia theta CCMP2712]